MGGFWPSAASALENWSAAMLESVSPLTTGFKSDANWDSATVWQAWQAVQDSQCVLAA